MTDNIYENFRVALEAFLDDKTGSDEGKAGMFLAVMELANYAATQEGVCRTFGRPAAAEDWKHDCETLQEAAARLKNKPAREETIGMLPAKFSHLL